MNSFSVPADQNRRGTTGGDKNRKAVESNLGNILVHDDLNILESEYIQFADLTV